MLSTEALISTEVDHYLKRVVINIRASKSISGLVKVSVTSPAGIMSFFLMLSPDHVLLVILRHMGRFKIVLNILIVHIPGLGRTLHLTKDMNDQMVEFGFQVKGES